MSDQDRSDVGEDADLDYQPLSRDTAEEVERIRAHVRDLLARQEAKPGSDDALAFAEWAKAILDSLPDMEVDSGEDVTRLAYATYNLSHTVGGRTYSVELRVGDAFGPLKEQVRDVADLMLQRATADQTVAFFRRAKAVGDVTWRRNLNYAFPIRLPYRNPPPTTKDGIFAEEAAVVDAAVFFALVDRTPRVRMYINRFDKPPRVRNGRKTWTLGSAPVNSFNGKRYLEMRLNAKALSEAGLSEDSWASTIAHEALHNLGWGHPNGSYPATLAIEIWEYCIRNGRPLVEDDAFDVVR